MIKTKALIHYFSGTGNSARVASLVAEELLKSGIVPYLRPITEGKLPYRSTYNLHVFVFPTYSFTLPAIMQQYLAITWTWYQHHDFSHPWCFRLRR